MSLLNNDWNVRDYHLIIMSKDTIFSITQSVLSVLIVAGGGLAMLYRPDADNAAIVGLMSAVITFYFTQGIATRTATQTASNMQAATAQQQNTQSGV